MSTMADIFNAERVEFKKRCEKRNNKYEPRLIEAGAIKKSDAVYELNGWLCYPTKGFAMLKKDNAFRTSINALLEMIKEEKEA